MRIAIIGAGAMGSLLAGMLATARDLPAGPDTSTVAAGDTDIWLVGGPSSAEHLRVVVDEGLRFELTPAAASSLPVAVTERLRGAMRGIRVTLDAADAYPCGLAVVLVKSYRTAEAGRQVARLLAPDGLALSLQNGLGNAETLSAHVGRGRVTAGTTVLGAELRGPGRVLWAAPGATTLPDGPDLPEAGRRHLGALAVLLGRLGVPVGLAPDVAGAVWAKLLINCAVNPAAALLDTPNGALLAHEGTRRLMADVAREVALVARAAGVALPFPDDAAPAHVLHAVEVTAANVCSMLQDLRRGRPTEIEALNGAVVREAERRGLDAPVNRTLADLIRARQAVAR